MNWICSHCGEKFSRYRTRCPHDGSRVIDDLAGQLIGGRYRIRELIGVGGMDSTVWKAWQTGTERTVAIKVLPPADEAAARRFARGARIAANLNHPNCSIIHDYGKTDDGKLYLVMEFLQGQVLQEVLGPSGTTTMPVADTVHVAIQVLDALEHAHSERAVHRDLKPDNLFLTRKNEDPLHVKILDFGIAKYVEEDPTDTSTDAEEKPSDGFEDLVTEQRQVCGTPQYMAPEQVVGARIDQRTDLYSLGCVMYRMLTGRLPFDGKTRYELYQKHLQEPPQSFANVRPDLAYPDRLELIVMKSLMKRPDQRFQSASEMRKALQELELAESTVRRANRPRVALKDTSPQSPGAHPTILPPSFAHVAPGASPFTLSAPSPSSPSSPLVVVEPTLAASQGAPPPLPFAGKPAAPPLSAAMRPPTLPVVSGLEGLKARAGNTAVAPAAPVPVAPEPVPSRLVARPATDMLHDAVMRHPASRSTLSVVAAPIAVPKSSETQPNKADDVRDSRRRSARVAAILIGAFGIGVGAVALVMKVTQGPTAAKVEPAIAVAPMVAAMDKKIDERATPRIAEPIAQGANVQRVEAGTPSVEATRVTAPGHADMNAGALAGAALGEVGVPSAPLAPTKITMHLDSEPSGATVKDGAQLLGLTPFEVSLDIGRHELTVERAGMKPAALHLDVQSDGATDAKIVLEPVTPAKPQGVHPVRPTIPTLSNEPVIVPETKPQVPDPKPADDGKAKPQVKLLDDGEPTNNKKPTVKLLDDDDGAAKPGATKPKVKVLDD